MFVDQLATLLAVAVGAAGSYATTTLTDRTRWRREKSDRWHEKKFDVYARYGNTLKEQIWITQRIGAALGYAHVVDPLSPADGLELLAAAESRRAAVWESVLLVGDVETITAARSWHEAIWTLELHVREQRHDAQGWIRDSQRVSQRRDAFYVCARRELGVAGPPPPSGNWPRHWQPQDDPAS
ncbi:hypothetical protein ABZX90_17105 [Streptomyces sp. NPDC002935]|uniref:hypothetical protein n=1 Tax=Streptomyces sp. NPDC002935 TaxID=3154545 RepID=UPI0033BA4321